MENLSYITNWDQNLIFFTQDAKLYIHENTDVKELSQVNLREKVDFYTMDMYGRIDHNLENIDFGVNKAIAHSKF